MLLVKLLTLLRLTDDELDILERHINNELPSGIYSCGINSIEGIRADSTSGLPTIGLGHVATHS
jgi:hypothetical protein